MFGVYAVLIVITLNGFGATEGNNELDLYRYLQSQLAAHDKFLRPVRTSSDTLTITVGSVFENLLDVDEKGQTITMKMVWHVTWRNEFINWYPPNYSNINFMFLEYKEAWYPDLKLISRVEGVGTGDSSFSSLTVLPNGTTYMTLSMVFKIFCDMNLSRYPFDSHICNFHLSQELYRDSQVEYDILDVIIEFDDISQNTEYEITDMTADFTKYHTKEGLTEDRISYSINFSRLPNFTFFMIFMPMSFLYIMSSLAFLLPPNMEVKSDIQLSVMLGFSVYGLILSNVMPPASSLPISGVYLLQVMGIIVLSLFISIITTTLSTKTERRPPRCLYKVCCILSCTSCSTMKNRNRVSVIRVAQADDRKSADAQEGESGLRKLIELMEEQKESSDINDEWTKMCTTIDRFYMICTLIVVLAINPLIQDQVKGFWT